MGAMISTIAAALLSLAAGSEGEPDAFPGVVYEGREGPGKGKHIVLVAGDEEYRSEEALPMLGKILSEHHGFRCTVLFSQNENGEIDPDARDNIPGLGELETADMLVLFVRFRKLPDEDMRWIVDHVESGRPVLGIRTATHAFSYPEESESRYKHWTWKNDAWRDGFGRQVLGETWVNHHGHHGKESTRGVIPKRGARTRCCAGSATSGGRPTCTGSATCRRTRSCWSRDRCAPA